MTRELKAFLKACTDDDGRRLDRILRKALPGHSLSLIHRLLRQGKIRVDGDPAGPETRVRAGAVIQIAARWEMAETPRHPSEEHPAPLPGILANGSGIVIFNKPAGLASHGPDSLDMLVKAHYARRPPSLSFRPGPLHRLDRSTSGAIAFSENLAGARLFSELLRERRVTKTYLAIVEGRVTPGAWRDDLVRDGAAKKTFVGTAGDARAKTAETTVRVLACGDRCTLIEARIATGRTHQIRAQAAARGHPLAGDLKYGGRATGDGVFFLHAWKIGFDMDINGLPRLVCAPPPKPFLAKAIEVFGRRQLQCIWS
ncbi:MAG: RluA family pseudouridine synthase [Treponema sp.]|nr:RluA family pseudouridine synthase [Treponema sp.]